MSTWELFTFPGVAPVIYIYGHTMLLAFAYTAGTSALPPIPSVHISNKNNSRARLLVHVRRKRRIRLLRARDRPLPWPSRRLPSYLDSLRLPSPPAPGRYWWYFTDLRCSVADFLLR